MALTPCTSSDFKSWVAIQNVLTRKYLIIAYLAMNDATFKRRVRDSGPEWMLYRMNGSLFPLQSRSGKRFAHSSLAVLWQSKTKWTMETVWSVVSRSDRPDTTTYESARVFTRVKPYCSQSRSNASYNAVATDDETKPSMQQTECEGKPQLRTLEKPFFGQKLLTFNVYTAYSWVSG